MPHEHNEQCGHVVAEGGADKNNKEEEQPPAPRKRKVGKVDGESGFPTKMQTRSQTKARKG